jgi:hypothetical protein
VPLANLERQYVQLQRSSITFLNQSEFLVRMSSGRQLFEARPLGKIPLKARRCESARRRAIEIAVPQLTKVGTARTKLTQPFRI